MPISITGLFAPSGGPGSFDLYAPEDIQAGDVNVILQAIAGGAFKGGSHATAPVGEIVAQVKSTTGAPSHSASEGTICWNSVDDAFYVNNNGSTGWTSIGGTAHVHRFNQDLTGTLNGTNLIFTTPSNFVTNSTRLYLNGIRQRISASYDYTETGVNEITFVVAPISGDSLLVDYVEN